MVSRLKHLDQTSTKEKEEIAMVVCPQVDTPTDMINNNHNFNNLIIPEWQQMLTEIIIEMYCNKNIMLLKID